MSEVVTGVKLLVYGQSKTGKTRIISTFPKPMLLMATEKGIASISTHSKLVKKGDFSIHTLYINNKKLDIDFVLLEQAKWFEDLVTGDGKYVSYCLDTAGGFLELCLKEVMGVDELVSRGFSSEGPRLQDWSEATQLFKRRINMLTKRVDSGECNWGIIAHERNFSSDDESGGSTDRIAPHIGAELPPKSAQWLHAQADFIGQTFIRRKEIEKQVKKPNGKLVTRKVTTDEMEYCMRIGAHPVYITGFRTVTDGKIPDVIVNATFDKVVSVARGNF